MCLVICLFRISTFFCCFCLSLGIIGDRLSCWPDNVVPYRIAPGFSDSQVEHIRRQINVIHNKTCIRWLNEAESNLELNDFVEFIFGEECYVMIKFIDKNHLVHTIKLNDYCFMKGFVLHEMIHALGFDHEHQRMDRDCYVEVDDEMVNDQAYKVVKHDYDGGWLERFPYDKYSITHYPRGSHLKSKSERWFDFWQPLGNAEGVLTDLDVWKLQYKFCNFPHYCVVFPNNCELMDISEKDCYDKTKS